MILQSFVGAYEAPCSHVVLACMSLGSHICIRTSTITFVEDCTMIIIMLAGVCYGDTGKKCHHDDGGTHGCNIMYNNMYVHTWWCCNRNSKRTMVTIISIIYIINFLQPGTICNNNNNKYLLSAPFLRFAYDRHRSAWGSTRPSGHHLGLLHPTGANVVLSYPPFVRDFFLSIQLLPGRFAWWCWTSWVLAWQRHRQRPRKEGFHHPLRPSPRCHPPRS